MSEKPKYLTADYISDIALVHLETAMNAVIGAIDLPTFEAETELADSFTKAMQAIVTEIDKEMLAFGELSIDEFKGSRDGQGWKNEH